MFNLIVNNVVSNWLVMTVEDQLVYHDRLGLAAGRCLGLFYADNDRVILRDTEWIQGALNSHIGLFCRSVLLANVVKSKSMTCQPGTLQCEMSEEVVGQQCTERGETYHQWLRRHISYLYCRVELTAGLMTAHRRRIRGADPEVDWNQFPVSHT